MPCCGQAHVFQQPNSIKKGDVNLIVFQVVLEESQLPSVFSFSKSCNLYPVELKSTLYPIGMVKFLYVEAGLQISNTGTPGRFEGKYVGKAVFEKQGRPSLERMDWLPLL